MKLGELCSQHVVSVAPQDSVRQAVAVMEEHGVHHLPVVSGRDVVGIVSDRDIMIGCGGSALRQGQALELGNVEGIMSTPVTVLSPDDALRSATWLMIHRRVHAIPLMHRERLVGIVTESDLLRGVTVSPELSHQLLLEQPIVNFMRDKVTTVRAKTPLSDVVDIMQQERIRHLPVAIGDQLLGIVSDRDVRRALAQSALLDAEAQDHGKFYLGPTEVHEVMTKDVHTIPPSATVQQAIADLLQNAIHSLLIVDHRKLVGIVTDTDLLRAIGADDKEAS